MRLKMIRIGYITLLSLAAILLTGYCIRFLNYGSDSSTKRNYDYGSITFNWTIRFNDQGMITTLPNVFDIPKDVNTIELSNYLPIERIDNGAIRFGGILQYVEIYIDGSLRATLGRDSDKASEFYLLSGDNVTIVPLMDSDYGKEIKLVFRNPSYFHNNLEMVNKVEIGSREYFTYHSYRFNWVNTVAFMLTIIQGITIFVASIYLLFRKFQVKSLFLFSSFLLCWVVFLISDNSFLFDMMGYSTKWYVFMNLLSKILGPLLVLLSTIIILRLGKFKLKKHDIIVCFGYMGIVLITIISGFFSIRAYMNISRYFLSLINFLVGIYLLVRSVQNIKLLKEVYFICGAFAIMFGSCLDGVSVLLCTAFPKFKPFLFIYMNLSSSFFLSIGFLVGIVFTEFGIFATVSRSLNGYKQEIALSNQKINFSEENFKTITTSIEGVKVLRHDMKHHLRAIYKMNEDNRRKDIEEYINDLLEDDGLTELPLYCDNFTINTLLGYYSRQFRKEGFLFNVSVFVPEHQFVTERHLTGLLGNIINNAYEACLKIKESKPYVDIDIKCDNEIFKISSKNSYEGEIKVGKGNKILSSKDSDTHGFGLVSIKRIVEVYNGYSKINYDENNFQIGVVLYNPHGVEKE